MAIKKNKKTGLRKQLREQRKANRITSRSELKEKRREQRDLLRNKIKTQRMEQRAQRQAARLSKRNAKKLEKIYGEMTPEEIEKLNAIIPYTKQMAEELKENGIELQDENDPVEVATRYAYANEPDNELFENEEVEEAIKDAYIEDVEDWDELDHIVGIEKKLNAFKKVGNILGDVAVLANKYIDGDKNTPLSAGVNAFKKTATKATIGDFFEKNGLLLVVGVIVLLVFIKK